MNTPVTTLARTRADRTIATARRLALQNRHSLIAYSRLPRRVQALQLVMASPTSVLAVVRAAAPTFRSACDASIHIRHCSILLIATRPLGQCTACRNPHDQLAFAVHAAVLSSGYRLVAVGEQAQLEGAEADISHFMNPIHHRPPTGTSCLLAYPDLADAA